MAEVQRKKQGKKTELNINVVIGGFLVLGGALAAAAVIAVFKNRSKRKPNNRSKKDPPANPLEEVNCTKNKEDIQGLRSLLRIPSLSDEKDQRKKEALRICSTQVGSRGPVTIENLILEKEFGLKSNGEEQTPTFEDHGPVLDNLKKSPPEADDYDSNKNGIPIDVEGVNLGVLENGSMKIVDSTEDPIYLPLVETEVVIEESVEIPEETRIVHIEERVVKEDVSVQEEEDDDDDEEDDDDDEEEDEEESVEEKEGEGSDGTGDSSMHSNAEAIWPAESLEIREMKTTHVEISGKKGEKEAQKANNFEVVKGTNQEHEENGKFKNARETKEIMGKEKGMGTPIMEMEMSARSSLISRLLLLSMIMGLAVLFLSHILSCNLYDFSNTLPKFF